MEWFEGTCYFQFPNCIMNMWKEAIIQPNVTVTSSLELLPSGYAHPQYSTPKHTNTWDAFQPTTQGKPSPTTGTFQSKRG